MRVLIGSLCAALVLYSGACALLYWNQDLLLFYPTHDQAATDLSPWIVDGKTIGYCREVPHPEAIWLMTHGNGGQANQRSYVCNRMSGKDSLFVLEYPGYGSRSGFPSARVINRAAQEAFDALRKEYASIPVCVLGESMGSAPACYLAAGSHPADKLVLIVPFDALSSVAAEKFPFFPVRLLMTNDWNNVRLLKTYRGPVEIFGAIQDEVIPVAHAKNLAAQVAQAKFYSIEGGHGWADSPSEIRLTP